MWKIYETWFSTHCEVRLDTLWNQFLPNWTKWSITLKAWNIQCSYSRASQRMGYGQQFFKGIMSPPPWGEILHLFSLLMKYIGEIKKLYDGQDVINWHADMKAMNYTNSIAERCLSTLKSENKNHASNIQDSCLFVSHVITIILRS